MLTNTIQWLRNTWMKQAKKFPSKDMEAYYLNNWKLGRHPKPNPRRLAYFCFPCGQYHDDIAKHEAMKKHKRNKKRWNKEMGYLDF